MASYSENDGVVNLILSGNASNTVSVTVNSFQGTELSTTIAKLPPEIISIGQPKTLGNGQNLKGTKVKIICDASSYTSYPASMEFIFREANGSSTTYTFPKDFKASNVPKKEKEAFLTFTCSFK